MTQPLADAVRDAGLTPCLFVHVTCKKCGDNRVTAKEKALQCPLCGEPAHSYVLGIGGTRRGRATVEPETKFRYESYSNVGI